MTISGNQNNEGLIPQELRERYQDCQTVGAGGMGCVFSALDLRLDKRVAIKVLPASNESPLAVMRFQQEAKAVSKLNHPNIVQVMDFGYTAASEPYLVMEHVKGESLESLIQRCGRLPLDNVIELAIQICTGLVHAHEHGVVHRDLKPANIMLDEDNNVRILDFGLAKILDLPQTDWRLTRPGQPMGSVQYMSPEQVRGEDADERTDIFSLGLVIYDMVNGAPPLSGANLVELLRNRLNEDTPQLPEREDAPELCQALQRVIKGSLERNPDDRYPDAESFEAALTGIDVEGLLPKPEAPAALRVNAGGRKLMVIAASIVVAVLVAGCIVFATIGTSKFVNLKWNDIEHPRVKPAAAKIIKNSDYVRASTIINERANLKDATDKDLESMKGSKRTVLNLEGNENITNEGLSHIVD
ncbi:MAG: serine/threonine protein kinase, partial [Cyanobacteria bacterium]|nr:serine/threonine protein kinase [Cyanobacteriota bacterium]